MKLGKSKIIILIQNSIILVTFTVDVISNGRPGILSYALIILGILGIILTVKD